MYAVYSPIVWIIACFQKRAAFYFRRVLCFSYLLCLQEVGYTWIVVKIIKLIKKVNPVSLAFSLHPSDLHASEVRAQLVEQLKCLDQQCELRVQLLQDLQDFFRKKAEIEVDYSRNLEKLAERFLTKTRSNKDHLLKYEHSHTHTNQSLLLTLVSRETWKKTNWRDHVRSPIVCVCKILTSTTDCFPVWFNEIPSDLSVTHFIRRM